MAGDLKSSLTDLQVRRYKALYSDFDRGRLERLVLANASSSNMTRGKLWVSFTAHVNEVKLCNDVVDFGIEYSFCVFVYLCLQNSFLV